MRFPTLKILAACLAATIVVAALYLWAAQALAGTVEASASRVSSQDTASILTGYCQVDPERCWQGRGAEFWFNEARRAERAARSTWRPSVTYAYRLAAALYRVPERELRAVGGCESGHKPWAQNPSSSAGGLMQYLASTWNGTLLGRAGFSRFDPVAAALMAARWHATSGSWAPWAASRGCHGLR